MKNFGQSQQSCLSESQVVSLNGVLKEKTKKSTLKYIWKPTANLGRTKKVTRRKIPSKKNVSNELQFLGTAPGSGTWYFHAIADTETCCIFLFIQKRNIRYTFVYRKRFQDKRRSQKFGENTKQIVLPLLS